LIPVKEGLVLFIDTSKKGHKLRFFNGHEHQYLRCSGSQYSAMTSHYALLLMLVAHRKNSIYKLLRYS